MKNEDFIRLMIKLESKKKEIRDEKGKSLSDIDQALIIFIDGLIFELLEEQSKVLNTMPQTPVFRKNPVDSVITCSTPTNREITKSTNER